MMQSSLTLQVRRNTENWAPTVFSGFTPRPWLSTARRAKSSSPVC